VGYFLKFPDSNLFEKNAEILLFKKLNSVTLDTEGFLEKGMYKEVLIALSDLKEPVDTFFQDVLVNTDDAVLKNNRLCLLSKLDETMNQVAELSLLVE
jgi:glycyl-tRNA synthetase beta chain